MGESGCRLWYSDVKFGVRKRDVGAKLRSSGAAGKVPSRVCGFGHVISILTWILTSQKQKEPTTQKTNRTVASNFRKRSICMNSFYFIETQTRAVPTQDRYNHHSLTNPFVVQCKMLSTYEERDSN